MKVFGLTGGVGMGKTTIAQFLAERGTRVVDTDVLAHQLVEPGEPALREIESAFGSGVIAPDGRLRRAELARIVFADDATRHQLEQILHPRIRHAWQRQLETWRSAGYPVAVVVIPLLFETRAEDQFDTILCAACRRLSQQERLIARGWTVEHIAQRNAAQLPIEQKMALSHCVLWTEGRLESTARQVDRVLVAL
jgi:dephospho-CoA kinase